MDFVVKTKEELDGMDAANLHSYYTAKLSHEKEALDARVKALESDKGNEDLAKEVKELRETQLVTLKETVVEQGRIMAKLRDGSLNAQSVKDAEGSIEDCYCKDFST